MQDSASPQRLGKYLIHEELGRGGFGTVYRATDTTLDRIVALKILDPLLTRDPGFLERFRREAVGAARLEHPNIVPVYEVGEAEGRSFIAMKYLPGRSLDKLLAEGRLPIERTLHILAQVAAALDFAHAKGIIHRDVKPSNILVGPDEASGDSDHATLTDFGLARASDQSIMTSLGQALGTPAYMAPEQLDVDRQGEVGAASDIYSFAVVAYEMLAGRPPFMGPTPAVMVAHLTKEPPPMMQFNAALPPVLWEVIKAGLAKDVARRPPCAAGLVTAIETAAREGLIETQESPIIEGGKGDKPIPPLVPIKTKPPIETPEPPKSFNQPISGWLVLLLVISIGVVLVSLVSRMPSWGGAGATTTVPTKMVTVTVTPTCEWPSHNSGRIYYQIGEELIDEHGVTWKCKNPTAKIQDEQWVAVRTPVPTSASTLSPTPTPPAPTATPLPTPTPTAKVWPTPNIPASQITVLPPLMFKITPTPWPTNYKGEPTKAPVSRSGDKTYACTIVGMTQEWTRDEIYTDPAGNRWMCAPWDKTDHSVTQRWLLLPDGK
jgi:serine/threonine-protein kinase